MNNLKRILRFVTTNHDKIYLWGLTLLAFSMPVSPFTVSVSQFILAGNWLVERNFKKKWQQIKSQPALLIFLSVFFIHIIGLFYSKDWGYGLHDIKIKLPLFGIPIIIASSNRLTPQKMWIIFDAFIIGVFTGTLISFGAYLKLFGFDYVDIREISIIISHIRFSLYIVLSIAILLFSIKGLESRHRGYVAIFLILWFHYFSLVLQAYTGLLLLALVDVIFIFYVLLKKLPRGVGLATCITLVLVAIFGAYFYINDLYKILKVKESFPSENERYTIYGNPYSFYQSEPVTENGYYIYWYVSREELDTAWNNRSDLALSGQDKKGQVVFYTLLRYLTSKELYKDAQGVQQLTKEDIENIENGIANYLYPEFDPIKRRTFKILWEIDYYRKGGSPAGHSVTQRFDFFKAGLFIFKKNFWFGVGTGDVKQAYREYYKTAGTQLSKEKQFRAHNQYLTFYLTFGVFIGTWILAALFLPLVIEKEKLNLISIVFLIIVFFSMIAEDTLETQAGVTFFGYFYSLFLFGRKENRYDLIE